MRAGMAWLFALAFGCSSSEASPGGTGGTGGTGGEAGSSSTGGAADCPVTLSGTAAPMFEQTTSLLRVYAGSYFTVVDGAILDGQRRELHSEAQRAGNCRLLTYESASFCDPPCESPELCVHGQCERFPEPVSAGTLSVDLGERTLELKPNELGRYYWATEDFGYDLVESVRVAAPGDVASGFELAACLSPAPEPTADWDQLMAARAAGEDVVLDWSDPVGSARVYLRMTTGIGTHGGISPVEIECEGPDVGTLRLPGSYLDALYADGWGCGECGVSELVRYHASEAGSGDAAVQLRAESKAAFWFHPTIGDAR